MKNVEFWDDEFLTAEFPNLKQQLAHVARGVSVQKAFLRRRSEQSLNMLALLQISIMIMSAIATFLVALKIEVFPLIFTTLTLVLTGLASVFDPKSHYLRREKSFVKLAALQDDMAYDVSKHLDRNARGELDPIVNEELVDSWHKRLAAILNELHEDKIAAVGRNEKE